MNDDKTMQDVISVSVKLHKQVERIMYYLQLDNIESKNEVFDMLNKAEKLVDSAWNLIQYDNAN